MKNKKKTILIIFIVAVITIIIGADDYDTKESNNIAGSQTLSSQYANSNNEITNESKLTKITDLSDEEISEIKDKITKESSLFYEDCEDNFEGECIDRNNEKYYIQSKVEDARPARTKQVLVGYRTLCRDGEYSPSNAKGRGACSHHGGVANWNAPVYDTEYIDAIPAQYKKEEIKMELTQVYMLKYNSITDDEIINYYNLYK